MKLNYKILAITILFTSLIFSQGNDPAMVTMEKAKKIHKNVITIDTHVDINVKNFTKEKNYTQDLPTQVNLPKMNKGGLDVAWLIVYTGQEELNNESYKKAYKNAMAKFDAIHFLVEKIAADKIELALTSADVKRIHASGKKVAMIGVENAYPIGTDIKNIKKFYDRGARYMSLAHQGHSQFSDSNTGEKEDEWLYDNGLSKLGKEAVKEMNRIGIMIDVSHPSKGAFMEMIKLSKAPIIASHSSARAICSHSRNLDDEQLLLLKENGGVVQTVAFSGYVNSEKDAAYKKAKDEIYKKIAEEFGFTILDWDQRQALNNKELENYNKSLNEVKTRAIPFLKEVEKTTPPVNVKDFVDHIDHMVELIGIDHVGISSDFDGGGGIEGWNDASETFNVTLELVKREYTEEEIAKLWGLNLLR
ncbi:MAG TPA: membrane dipeptidase, partial [Bacteroidetes bacterium]|nr:membrane dipeptidase [Bacteroidota bacterium]